MPDKVNRRKFLTSTAAGGLAAMVAGAGKAGATQQSPAFPAAVPSPAQEVDPTASNIEVLTTDRPGSDFMVDVIKSLGFQYISANPGSSFRGLQESIINYGGNQSPELLTCCHEESAVGMAHGYAKIEGQPMCVALHSTVGLQHAAMAIFNAYCDRVPVYLVIGNLLNATMRRPGVEWDHSAEDVSAMVRDFTKWDDVPFSLQHFAESAVRAYKIAMTPPMMPVIIVLDSELQENPVPADAKLHVPKLTLASPPQGDSGAVAEAARLLVRAENPVIVADRAARTPAGMQLLVELAEALQAPVVDKGARLNFPTRHPLNQTARASQLIRDADVILGLELTDFWGTVNYYRDQLHRTSQSIIKPGTKLISISTGDLYVKGNLQDLQRYLEVDLAIAADAEATLPSLIGAVKRLNNNDRGKFEDRRIKLAEAHRKTLERANLDARYGWDASPITTARLSTELWEQIKSEDWSLVSDVSFVSRWPLRLWTVDKYYQFIGGAGGAGQGYGPPAAVGAALANRRHGRLSINIQGDGDLMYAPGVLWTAAHHNIPLLTIMHNNRAYHQELMHIQRMANRHNRGITRATLGTTIQQPVIDYAKLASSMGVYGEGPISNPQELGPAIRRAIAVVKRGEPALIDVLTEPR